MVDRTALVLIDAQVRFLFGPPAVHRVDRLLDVLETLSTRARAAGVPVVHVRFDDRPHGKATSESEGYRVHPRLGPHPGDHVLTKRSTDAFHETGLGELLASLAVSRVVVAGCITELCVDTSCRRALTSGYHTTLVADGHSTPDRPLHGVSAAQRIALTNHVLARVGAGREYIEIVESADLEFGELPGRSVGLR